MRYYLKLLALPILFTVLFTSLFIIWELFSLPSEEVLAEALRSQFEKFGLPILFFSSILEGMLLLGNYFPGVFVIFLGVIVAETIPEAIIAVAVVTGGLIIAHLGNYALGRYGWYRLLVRFGLRGAIEKAKENLVRRGPIAILGSYWLPSVGALTDTAAGIMHMPFRTFIRYSLISTVLWDIAAGVLVYSFKDFALKAGTPGPTGMFIMYGLLGAWALIVVSMDFYRRRREGSKI